MKVYKKVALDINYNIISFNDLPRIEAFLVFEVDSDNPTPQEFNLKYNEIINNGIKAENIRITKNYYTT
jgi:hypothetical protein